MEFERPQIVRPPSEWASYFLPLTRGCSNTTCTFCAWHGSRLRVRKLEEVKAEIDALAVLVRHGIYSSAVGGLTQYWDGKKFFLQDADALVYPYPKLVEILQHLKEKFPGFERVACYATPRDILRRTRDELKMLRNLGLGIFYTGLESGSDSVLQRVRKRVNSSEMIEAGRKAREAGIQLSVSLILGLAGAAASEEHAIQTARVLSAIDPEYAAALTITLVPGTPLHQEWSEGNFQPPTPFQSLEELKTLVEQLDLTNCFFSSAHAVNYLNIRGRLPQDKARLVRELDAVLDKRDPALLRPEFLRRL